VKGCRGDASLGFVCLMPSVGPVRAGGPVGVLEACAGAGEKEGLRQGCVCHQGKGRGSPRRCHVPYWFWGLFPAHIRLEETLKITESDHKPNTTPSLSAMSTHLLNTS